MIGDRAEISSPIAYEAALADEPYRLIDSPLSTILDSQAPEAFRELWARDVIAFADSRKAKQVALLRSETPKETPMSVLDKIMSKITGRVKAKQKTALEQYLAAARQIADDKEPAEDISRSRRRRQNPRRPESSR